MTNSLDPSAGPIDFQDLPTQTEAAATEAGVGAPRYFKLANQQFEMASSIHFTVGANIQKHLTDFDLLELAEVLPRIVKPEQREALKTFLLTETEENDPAYFTILDVIDAWNNVQEILSARPTRK